MKLRPYSPDNRCTIVTFHSAEEVKWMAHGYGFLARTVIRFGIAKPEAGIRGISKLARDSVGEMPLEVVHKNTSLIKAAARLACYSVGRSAAHIASIREAAAKAQTVSNTINGFFAEQQPALPLEEIPPQPEEPVQEEIAQEE